MRRAVLAVVLAAIVLGAGYWGLVALPGQRFRGELDRALAQLPAGYTASYRDVSYAPFARHATIEGLALRGAGADRLELSVERIELASLAGDFGERWSRVRANAAAVAPGTALRVAGQIALSGIRYRLGDNAIAVARAQVDRLDLHPWALLHPQAPALTDVLPFLPDRAVAPAEIPALLRGHAAGLLGIAFRRLDIADVTTTAAGDGKAFALKRLLAERYVPGRIGNAAVEGLSISVDGNTLAVDRLAAKDIDAGPTLVRLLDGAAPGPGLFEGFALRLFDLAGVALTPGSEAPMRLDSLVIDNVAVAQGVPVTAAVTLKGLQFGVKSLGARLGADPSQLVDLDALTLDLAIAYEWDLATRRLALRNAALEARQLGRLELTLDLAELVPPDLRWQTAKLIQGRLRYVDESLAEHLLKVAAALMGVEPAAVRQQLLSVVRQQSFALGFNPATVSLISTLSEFIRAPRSLSVEVKPPASLTLEAARALLANPSGDVLATLGLRVTANQ